MTSDAVFAGSIPAIYDRHLGPLLFEDFANDIADLLAPAGGGRVLEVAAGTGIVTQAVIEKFGDAVSLVATDLNPDMLAFAQSKLSAPNLSYQPADALSLPFEDARFDAVICQFGVMFFPDKLKAFREARRTLRNGGLFIFNVWDRIEHNDMAHLVSDAVAGAFPVDPPNFLRRTPYGYFDIAAIESTLRAAGFDDIRAETITKSTRAAAPTGPAIGFCQGTPLRAEIEARAAPRLTEITNIAAAAVERRCGAGPVEGKIQAHMITARR